MEYAQFTLLGVALKRQFCIWHFHLKSGFLLLATYIFGVNSEKDIFQTEKIAYRKIVQPTTFISPKFFRKDNLVWQGAQCSDSITSDIVWGKTNYFSIRQKTHN